MLRSPLRPLLRPLLRSPTGLGSTTLVQKAIGILRKYGTNAHIYLPGVGTLSGITAGNYLDSAGVTAASVDNPVGLSLDALQAMTLGAELVTNGDNEAALFNLGVIGSQNITPSRVAAVGGRSGFVMRGLSSSAASVNHQCTCGNATLSANTTYLISVDVYVPTGGISSCKFFDNNDGSFFSPDVTTKDAWVTITAIRQPKATPWTLGFGNNSPDVVASGSPAFYLDNVSIKQIPGIHATQATTSNKCLLRLTNGKYSWQFDGVNDSLSLSAPLFQMSDDHVVIAGFNASAVGVYVFSHTNTSTGVHCATVRVASDGKPSAWWRDDSTAQDVLYGPSSIVGSAAVVTAKKAAALKSLRVNGSLASSAGTSLGTTTLNEYAIGKSGAAYMQGSIYPIIAIKGTLSDSDLLVLERFVGQLSGVSI